MILASLTGQTEEHLCSPADAEKLGAGVHLDVVTPFLQLKEEASHAGFDIQLDSGFRSFDRQLSIWNRKATGHLAVLDSLARPLDIQNLSERELVFAILRWSALPGASRHHWGTDLDVFDASSLPEGYEVQLIPEEVNPGGMFGPLHEWLDQRMEGSASFGFFRPYDRDRGGVAPERWHLSHGPVTRLYQEHLSVSVLREALGKAEIELKTVLLNELDEIYQRFVINTSGQPK